MVRSASLRLSPDVSGHNETVVAASALLSGWFGQQLQYHLWDRTEGLDPGSWTHETLNPEDLRMDISWS
jgi:hypothetical protein